MILRRSGIPLLLTVALLASAAGADEERAVHFLERGDGALKRKDYGVAEKHYREALKEMKTCLPARHGLGEALLAQEKKKEAILAFRRVVRDAAGPEPAPAKWKAFAARSRARLDKIDTLGGELERIVDGHVKKVVGLAVKYQQKDPDLAERALGVVLALRPDHERAQELRSTMASRGARRERAFDGEQIDDWDGGRSKWWSVNEGAIVADANDVATYIRTQKTIEGNFDVLMEARMTKTYGDVPFFALLGGWTEEYCHTRFGVMSGSVAWYELDSKDESDRRFRKRVGDLRKPFDPTKWTTYEIRYRGKKIHVAVNGREVAKGDRPERRTKGFVGILAQDCRLEIRRVDVLRR